MKKVKLFIPLVSFFVLSGHLFSQEKVYTWKNVPHYIKYEKVNPSNPSRARELKLDYNHKEIFLKFVVPMIVKIRNHLRKNEIIEIMKMVDEDEQEITRDFLYSIDYEVEKDEDFYKSWLAYLKERKFFIIKDKTECILYEIENTTFIPKTKKDKLRAERKKRNRIKNFEYIRDLLKKEGFLGETFEDVKENLFLYERTGKRLCPPFERYHVGFLPIFDSGIEIKKSEKFYFEIALVPSNYISGVGYDYSKAYLVHTVPYFVIQDFNYCHTGDEKRIKGPTCLDPYGFLIKVHYDYRPSLYIYRTWSGISTCNGLGESSDEF